MTVGLREIRFFVAVYELGSFTAAAQRENATQSGASQHVKNLEAKLGVPLFLRSKAAVTPLPVADIYYRTCIDILRRLDESQEFVSGHRRGESGTLAVGLMPTLTRKALAPALSAFAAAHPNTRLRVVEGYSAALVDLVRSGDLDFAVVPERQQTAGLTAELFLETREVLVMQRDSGLTHGEPARLADLPDLSLVLPTRANARRSLIEAYCDANNVSITRVLELDAMFATLDLVRRGGWSTILPAVMMSADDAQDFAINVIAGPAAMLNLMCIQPSRRGLSRSGAALLALLRSEATALDAVWSSAGGARKYPRATNGPSSSRKTRCT